MRAAAPRRGRAVRYRGSPARTAAPPSLARRTRANRLSRPRRTPVVRTDERRPPRPSAHILSERALRRRRSGSSRAVAASVAIGLALSPRAPPSTRMFSPTRVESLIPTAIVALFLWGLARALVRRRHVAALARGFDLPRARRDTTTVRARWTRARARPGRRRDPIPRRCMGRVPRAPRAVARTAPGLQNADVVAPAARGAGTPRTSRAPTGRGSSSCWALPVLGPDRHGDRDLARGRRLRAVPRRRPDDVAEIKKNLVSVHGGLSFAFLITLIGLATVARAHVLRVRASSAARAASSRACSSRSRRASCPRLQEVAPAEAARAARRGRALAPRLAPGRPSETTRTRDGRRAVDVEEILQADRRTTCARRRSSARRKTWDAAALKVEAFGQAERDRSPRPRGAARSRPPVDLVEGAPGDRRRPARARPSARRSRGTRPRSGSGRSRRRSASR
jgi:hypothetical protein